jgi:hypothetical protein
MLPMVPCEIPAQPWEDIRIEPDLQLPPGIAADDPIREELATAKQQLTLREVISGLYARIRSAKKAFSSSERWPSTRIEPNPPYGNNGAASSFLRRAS